MSAAAGVACAIVFAVLVQAPSRAATVPLSISIQGNHFVNGAGQTIRLLGVNHPSSEYACVDGFGYNDGHQDDADAAAIASWNANAVRVPLNEDCWLGINGQPNNSQDPDETLTADGYKTAVENYVAQLNAHGLYAILDLHWSAPGDQVADSQQPMPDAHSTDFWQSVAQTFKTTPAVVFDLFNEPFDPTDPKSGSDNDLDHKVSWQCWENGGCVTQSYQNQGADLGSTYPVVGMQTLLNAVRNAGATQPIMTGGLDYANDLSGWVDNAPDDPLNQEAASFHNYMGKACDNETCWNGTIAAVAANVPVVTGEFDEDNYLNNTCDNKTPSTFDNDYMSWADQHGVSYTAWGWYFLSPAEISDQKCNAFYLFSDLANHTPAAPNGTALHDHLLTLPPGGVTSTTTTTPTSPTSPPKTAKPPVKLKAFNASANTGGSSVAFTLRTTQNCTGTLTGQTVSKYALAAARAKRHKVSLGKVRFSLKGGKAKKVVLKLSKTSRTLLAAQHRLKVQITITLTGATTRTTIIRRTITLKAPRTRARG